MKTRKIMKIFSIALALIVMSLTAVFLTACRDKKIPTKETFNPEGYEVTYFDDFNGTTLNTDIWNVETFEEHGNKRRNAYYSADNVFVEDGNLKIRTNYQANGANGAGWYTGWADMLPRTNADGTKAGFAQKYGYFEVKAMAPPMKGAWSAAWMMPADGGGFGDNDIPGTAADGCEIDIMESPGYTFGESVNQHVLHSGKELKTQASPRFLVEDMYTTYHTYSVEWTDTEFTFYIDGYKTWTTKYVVDGKELGVSKVLQYLILSVEVAPIDLTWAGNADDNDKSKHYDYKVDYVKIMQKS